MLPPWVLLVVLGHQLEAQVNIKPISTKSASRPIQSINHNVRGDVVPSVGTRNRMDRRLLVKECIAKIAKLRTRVAIHSSTIINSRL